MKLKAFNGHDYVDFYVDKVYIAYLLGSQLGVDLGGSYTTFQLDEESVNKVKEWFERYEKRD